MSYILTSQSPLVICALLLNMLSLAQPPLYITVYSLLICWSSFQGTYMYLPFINMPTFPPPPSIKTFCFFAASPLLCANWKFALNRWMETTVSVLTLTSFTSDLLADQCKQLASPKVNLLKCALNNCFLIHQSFVFVAVYGAVLHWRWGDIYCSATELWYCACWLIDLARCGT